LCFINRADIENTRQIQGIQPRQGALRQAPPPAAAVVSPNAPV
jgi:hypothetical protein